jgi:predicted enzyme related to lactoylglutathione lyase
VNLTLATHRIDHRREKAGMDWKLEVVVVPVSDVDRAKSFYTEKAGFNTDLDDTFADDFRIVQLTPPGSACSIMIGTGVVDTSPGSVQACRWWSRTFAPRVRSSSSEVWR